MFYSKDNKSGARSLSFSVSNEHGNQILCDLFLTKVSGCKDFLLYSPHDYQDIPKPVYASILDSASQMLPVQAKGEWASLEHLMEMCRRGKFSQNTK